MLQGAGVIDNPLYLDRNQDKLNVDDLHRPRGAHPVRVISATNKVCCPIVGPMKFELMTPR